MTLKDKIRKAIEESGLSDREVARRLGDLSATTIGRWKTGESEPRLSEAKKFSEMFGLPITYLADDTQDLPPDSPGETERLLALAQAIEGRRPASLRVSISSTGRDSLKAFMERTSFEDLTAAAYTDGRTLHVAYRSAVDLHDFVTHIEAMLVSVDEDDDSKLIRAIEEAEERLERRQKYGTGVKGLKKYLADREKARPKPSVGEKLPKPGETPPPDEKPGSQTG